MKKTGQKGGNDESKAMSSGVGSSVKKGDLQYCLGSPTDKLRAIFPCSTTQMGPLRRSPSKDYVCRVVGGITKSSGIPFRERKGCDGSPEQ